MGSAGGCLRARRRPDSSVTTTSVASTSCWGWFLRKVGLPRAVLEGFDVTADRVRGRLVRLLGSVEEITSGPMPFTPRAKRVLECAGREALRLGHNYVGTEHIVLCLLREREGVAVRILRDLDAPAAEIHREVLRTISRPPRELVEGGSPDGPRLGWRSKSIALAALGATALDRRAFSGRRPDGLDPRTRRLLVAIAVINSLGEDEPRADFARTELRALALCDDDELDAATGVLLARGLIEFQTQLEGLPPEEEYDDEHPVLTDDGADAVQSWLRQVGSLFTGWPPDRPDVDDAR